MDGLIRSNSGSNTDSVCLSQRLLVGIGRRNLDPSDKGSQLHTIWSLLVRWSLGNVAVATGVTMALGQLFGAPEAVI